jgi:hypothetical protein
VGGRREQRKGKRRGGKEGKTKTLEMLQNIRMGKDFLDKTPKAQETKQKWKMGLHPIKKLLIKKGNTQQRDNLWNE